MNDHDLALIERHFQISLPADYRRGMRGFPSGVQLDLNGQTLLNDPERLIVLNLELRADGPMFAGKEWPDNVLAIGDDGCGDYFCLSVGTRPSDQVLSYDHDPRNDFVTCAPTFSKFVGRPERWLGGQENKRDSEPVGPGLVITRAEAPWKSILHPIDLDEWARHVAIDPELEMIGYYEMQNPFTGEIIRVNQPGRTIWKRPGGDPVMLDYRYGRIHVEAENDLSVRKFKACAQALGARLFNRKGEKC